MAQSEYPAADGPSKAAHTEQSTPQQGSRKPTEAPRGEGQHNEGCLSHEDAVAASPTDGAVAGEEDAGIGVEYLIRESDERAKNER